MGKQLTIGQTAKRLGLEVDTVRKLERAGKLKAVRTAGGHRRFTEEAIDRFRKERKRASVASRPTRAKRPSRAVSQLNRHPRTGEFLPADVEVMDDFEDFEEDFEPEEEYGAPQPSASVVQAPAPAPVLRPKPSSDQPVPGPSVLAQVARQIRLDTIKGYGRAAMPWSLPTEWQARVLAHLEGFVTPAQFPDGLSHTLAAELVRASVGELLQPYHETVRRASEAKKSKETNDRCRQNLVTHGLNYSMRETGNWDWASRAEGRDEVRKVLEREVAHDWTEREVEGAVDEVLDQWDDEDDLEPDE